MSAGSGEYACFHSTTARTIRETYTAESFGNISHDALSLNPGTVTPGGMLSKWKEAVMSNFTQVTVWVYSRTCHAELTVRIARTQRVPS
jgi:hypothetical protein